MNKKKWFDISKGIIFFVLVGIIFIKALNILNYKDTGGGGGWQNFYSIPEKTIDVMFFGSSHAHCTIDHGKLWDEYGIAGYTLSAGSQMLDSTYYFVKEALEVQKPKLLVVEVWGSVLTEGKNGDEIIYRNALGMKWSDNLLEFVNCLVQDVDQDASYRNRILAKMPIVHSRYKELVKEDFVNNMPYMVGYRGSFDVVEFEQPVEINEEIMMPMGERCEEYIYKIIDLAKEYETDVLFIASPYILSDEEQMILNNVAKIATENNVPMINYNHLADELQIDYKRDFRDEAHVNNYGAKKVTSHLGEYIKNNYEIPDRRLEEGYEAWDLNKRYLDNKWITKALTDSGEINTYLETLSTVDDRLVILSLNGNHTAAGDVYYDSLATLGIGYEDYVKGGVWVFENKVPTLYLEGKEYNQCYEITDGEIHFESEVVDVDGYEEQQAEIIFEGKNYSTVQNGINVLVYDPVTKQMIDHVGTDIYVNFDVIRNMD